MHPEILRVHDIESSIRDVGLEYYVDRLLQDDMGNYYYVETIQPGGFAKNGEDWEVIGVKYDVEGETQVLEWMYRISPVPEQLAYFIIDCLKLKSMVMETGNHEYNGPHGGRLQILIPPGKEILGHVFDVAKEIPAELGPVVIERL